MFYYFMCDLIDSYFDQANPCFEKNLDPFSYFFNNFNSWYEDIFEIFMNQPNQNMIYQYFIEYYLLLN